MKVIISPAKKMVNDSGLSWIDYPEFIDKAEIIKNTLKNLSIQQLKSVYNCNDEIVNVNYERLENMNLKVELTPAILAYSGIQYQYMAPGVLQQEQLDWIQNHLRIISALYGLLKPFDGVVSYRLEMQAHLNIDDYDNLYDYWNKDIYSSLTSDDHEIVNLASKEYSKTIEKYLNENDKFINVNFYQNVKGKFVQKATIAKMARGAMVRFMAVNQVEKVEDIKKFNELDFEYNEKLSDEKTISFVQKVK